ncbi:MAG: APC family permease [Deinococcota bacterium]
MTTTLKRELGVFGAVMMGLGSIVGTGVFVSIGIAAGIVGPAVILATLIAAATATFNGLSSAQLAANHAVSGGTYEYGYRYLRPQLGFIAGWLFLIAKSASAATAALGFSSYLLNLLGVSSSTLIVVIALIATTGISFVLVNGIRRSNQVNVVIVSITLVSLVFFILVGFPNLWQGDNRLQPFFQTDGVPAFRALLQASALMFVAYTGYGRIATLGEEVREPRRTIPMAIITTLIVVMTLYSVVALVAVSTLGAIDLAQVSGQAPLERAAAQFNVPFAPLLVAIGAMTAMLGVLLNLLLGLSRVLLAMGRRGDMPTGLAKLSNDQTSPTRAIITMTVFVALLALIGNVTVTWSFSAFTVLVYYAITNLAALQLSDEERFVPAWVSIAGLVCCLGLAAFVQPWVWLTGLGVIALGFGWQIILQRIQQPNIT